MSEWKHDDLAYDLAKWLKAGAEHWVWLNAALGEWSGPRPDIMAYRRYRYAQPAIRAFEAKISRADLLSDLRGEKWKSYLEHCSSVTFIMPHGLCKKDEIPAECGVMFRTGRGWRTERRPQDIGVNASVTAMAKLLTCHPLVMPEVDEQRLKYRQDGWRTKAANSFVRSMGERFGREVQSYMMMKAEGRDPVARAQEQAEKIVADARRQAEADRASIKPVIEALGLGSEADTWSIASLIRERAACLSADGQLRHVRNKLAEAQRALSSAEGAALSRAEAA